MEQPCYKCGQLAEEGRPFCPHCAAPQIRVVIAEPVTVPILAEAGASEGAATLPASQTMPVLALPAPWSQALKPCALAAIVATLLMFLGLNPLVGMFSAGFLAVIFYRGSRPGSLVKSSTGARLGALGGLLFFAIAAFITAAVAVVPDLRSRLQEQVIENVQKWVASHPGDPRFQAALEQLKTPDGFVTTLILAGVILLIVSIVLGGLSGAVTAALLSRRNRQ